jgi:hypothetical protein
MRNKELDTLSQLSLAIANPATTAAARSVTITDPIKEVENSLTGFLTYRLGRLQDSVEYEEQIKGIILERISEASFDQLTGLLRTVQSGNTLATEKLLQPFISQGAGKTLNESLRATAAESEASIGSSTYDAIGDKQTLQAIDALGKLVQMIVGKDALEIAELADDEEEAPD